jgi:hypothetical protein
MDAAHSYVSSAAKIADRRDRRTAAERRRALGESVEGRSILAIEERLAAEKRPLIGKGGAKVVGDIVEAGAAPAKAGSGVVVDYWVNGVLQSFTVLRG